MNITKTEKDKLSEKNHFQLRGKAHLFRLRLGRDLDFVVKWIRTSYGKYTGVISWNLIPVCRNLELLEMHQVAYRTSKTGTLWSPSVCSADSGGNGLEAHYRRNKNLIGKACTQGKSFTASVITGNRSCLMCEKVMWLERKWSFFCCIWGCWGHGKHPLLNLYCSVKYCLLMLHAFS